MGGSSEKSLSDWMVRQGMVRSGQATPAGVPPKRCCSLEPEESGGLPSPAQCSAQPTPSTLNFHDPSVLPRKQGPSRPSGSWEVTGARLVLGRGPAEGAGVGIPENSLPLLLLLLLESQLPLPTGAWALSTELGG